MPSTRSWVQFPILEEKEGAVLERWIGSEKHLLFFQNSGSTPPALILQFPTNYSSSSRASDVFCWPSLALHTCGAQIYVQARHHTSKHRINEGTCHLGVVPRACKPSALEAGAGDWLQFEDRHSLKQRGMSLQEQSEPQFLSGVSRKTDAS